MSVPEYRPAAPRMDCGASGRIVHWQAREPMAIRAHSSGNRTIPARASRWRFRPVARPQSAYGRASREGGMSVPESRGRSPGRLWSVWEGYPFRVIRPVDCRAESPRRFLHVERQSRVSVAPSGGVWRFSRLCVRLDGIRAGACYGTIWGVSAGWIDGFAEQRSGTGQLHSLLLTISPMRQHHSMILEPSA